MDCAEIPVEMIEYYVIRWNTMNMQQHMVRYNKTCTAHHYRPVENDTNLQMENLENRKFGSLKKQVTVSLFVSARTVCPSEGVQDFQ